MLQVLRRCLGAALIHHSFERKHWHAEADHSHEPQLDVDRKDV